MFFGVKVVRMRTKRMYSFPDHIHQQTSSSYQRVRYHLIYVSKIHIKGIRSNSRIFWAKCLAPRKFFFGGLPYFYSHRFQCRFLNLDFGAKMIQVNKWYLHDDQKLGTRIGRGGFNLYSTRLLKWVLPRVDVFSRFLWLYFYVFLYFYGFFSNLYLYLQSNVVSVWFWQAIGNWDTIRGSIWKLLRLRSPDFCLHATSPKCTAQKNPAELQIYNALWTCKWCTCSTCILNMFSKPETHWHEF